MNLLQSSPTSSQHSEFAGANSAVISARLAHDPNPPIPADASAPELLVPVGSEEGCVPWPF